MKLLVTGATGFLGGALVPLLLEDGHEVRVLARGGAPDAEALGCELATGDVRDPDAVRRALQGREGLYHLAGLVSRDPRDAHKMYELHVNGTRVLLAEAERAGLRRAVPGPSARAHRGVPAPRVAPQGGGHPRPNAGA